MNLVTGCNSLPGRALMTRLLAEGQKVRGMDTWKTRDFPETADFIEGTVLDYEIIQKACEDVKVIYHLMDVENPAHSGRRHMRKMNIKGTENIILAAKEFKIRKILFLSTAEVYGKPKAMPIRQDDPKKPITPYGKDKLKAEKICWRFIEAEGMDITIFRPTIIAGAGIDDSMILIILYMALAMGDANQLYISGDVNTRFQLAHTDDVVDAMLIASSNSVSRGKVYNLGSDDVPTQMEQVVKVKEKSRLDCQIKHISPFFTKFMSILLKPLNINYLRKEHVLFILSNFVLDCDRAKIDLGWQPKMNNIDIFTEAIDWYKKVKL